MGHHVQPRYNSQWRLATIDTLGYASGPFGNFPSSTDWLKYNTEFKLEGMRVDRTIIKTALPAWRSGVACVETEPALQHFFERADREHKWVVAALWRPDCADCDWMWQTMENVEQGFKSDTFFLAVDVDRCYRFVQNQPVLGELPAFLIFGDNFEKKVVLSTPDFNDVLRCLARRRQGMPCTAPEVRHGDVWEQDNHNADVNTINADYEQYTPNLVQDVAYSLGGHAGAAGERSDFPPALLQLDDSGGNFTSTLRATEAPPEDAHALMRRVLSAFEAVGAVRVVGLNASRIGQPQSRWRRRKGGSPFVRSRRRATLLPLLEGEHGGRGLPGAVS